MVNLSLGGSRMKPDFESQKLKNKGKQGCVETKKINKPPINIKSHQSLKPSLFKTIEQQIENISRQHWISDAAYYKAQARGFFTGYEINDWLEAEQDFDEMLVDLFLPVFREDGVITIKGLQQLAGAIGVVRPERIGSKLELIRQIQLACNHPPCFRVQPGEFCQDQAKCQWKNECQKLIAEWWR